MEERLQNLRDRRAVIASEIEAIEAEQLAISAEQAEVDRKLDVADRAHIPMRRFVLLLVWFVASYFVFGVLGTLALNIGSRLETIYRWCAESAWHSGVGGGVVMLLGNAAYQFRKHQRKWYGAFEVGVAVASSAAILQQPRSALLQTSALAGAVYFVVRGLDNVYIGTREEFERLEGRVKEPRVLLNAAREHHARVAVRVAALGERLAVLKSLRASFVEEAESIERELEAVVATHGGPGEPR